MDPANFCFFTWENGNMYSDGGEINSRNLPAPVDTYRPGHLSMGKNVDRGLSIQRARGRKKHEANKAFFLANVLPMIEHDLNPAAWCNLAVTLQMPEFYARGGWVKYALGERASWIHESEQEKIATALAMGAKPQKNP